MTLPAGLSDTTMLALGLLALILLIWRWDHGNRRNDRVRERLQRAATGNFRTQVPISLWQHIRERGIALFERTANAATVLRFLGTGNRNQTRALLERAGYRSNSAVRTFFAVKLIACVLGFALALLLNIRGLFQGNEVLQGALLFVGFFVGGLVPEFLLNKRVARRQADVRASLPDAIDLLIIAANSGQSLEVALTRIGMEIRHHSPTLSDELMVTVSELRALPDRHEAIDNFAKRTDVPEARSFTATLVQTIRYGTPLSQALKVLAAEQRSAKILALEEKAAKLPAILALPLMILIMPSIFIVTAGPALLSVGEALFGA